MNTFAFYYSFFSPDERIQYDLAISTAGSRIGSNTLADMLASPTSRYDSFSDFIDGTLSILPDLTIDSNAGTVTISTTGSSGAGTITVTLKSGGNLILNNLPTSSGVPGSVYIDPSNFLKIS